MEELRALVANHINTHRDEYAHTTGIPIQKYVTDVEEGASGGINELRAFGDALACSTFCYTTHTRMWNMLSEGGLLDGKCVALFLEMGYFHSLFPKTYSGQEFMDVLQHLCLHQIPSTARQTLRKEAVDILGLKAKLKGRRKEKTAGQPTIESYFGTDKVTTPNPNPNPIIVRVKEFCSLKDVRVKFLKGTELLGTVDFAAHVNNRVRQSIYMEVTRAPVSLRNFAMLCGAQFGVEVVLFEREDDQPDKTL